MKWFEKLLVDLRKRIETNTSRLKATERPMFLVEDQRRLDELTGQVRVFLSVCVCE